MAASGGGQFAAKTTVPGVEEVAVPSFEQQFTELTSLIAFFEECSNETQKLIESTRQVFFQGETYPSVKPDLMTDTERKQLQSYASKKSTLLVVGQTNSGKSSLINELLGGSYMPTSEVPCTSRIVRLKYSNRNYIQVLNGLGGSHEQPQFFSGTRVPEAAIVLEETNRDDAEWVNSVVEVGLNNSLLQNGHLEVIDAPGMSENDILDKIVEECIQGALQVIIYVIDGNSSLRLQEKGFLLDLKKKVGHLPIFYVCNKVDHDKRAREFDKDSTSEEEDDDEEEEGNRHQRRTAEQKQELPYDSLVRCDLLSTDIPLAECEDFHGISCKEVRTARRRNQTNHYTQQFNHLKTKLLNFAARGVTSHLDGATRLLRQIQERVFELFLSRDVNDDELCDQNQLFDNLERKEQRYVDDMTRYINKNKDTLARIIDIDIADQKQKIAGDAGDMEFAPIQIGDVVDRNEVVHQCEKQIRDVVLFKVLKLSMKRVHKAISVVTKKLRDSLNRMFNEVARKDDRVGGLVTMQMKYSFLQPFQLGNESSHFDYAMMKFGTRSWDEAKKVVSDMWSAVSGNKILLNRKWKHQVALNVLESVDPDAIAGRICSGILSDLAGSHEVFKLNLTCMKDICCEAAKQSDDRRKYALVMAPYYARQMCKTEALSEALSYVLSKVDLGAQLERQGHRGTVYEVRLDGRVAKQLKRDHKTYDDCLLAIRGVMRRIQDDHPSILKPVRLILDKENRITILFPRMESDLFNALESGRVRSMEMSIRLNIVQNMIEAHMHCWGKKIHHLDFRITNILLDQNNTAKLNVSKPRNDAIPYPDKKAPFHVPARDPDPYKADPSAVGILEKHCLYGLTVLLWILLGNEYCRHDYADTADVEGVFAAVAQRKDVKYVSDWKVPDSDKIDSRWEALEIVRWSLEAWHDNLPSWLHEFKTKITWLISTVLEAEETLLQTLPYISSKVDLGAPMERQGHRGTVYEVHLDGRVGKQLKRDHKTYDDCSLAIKRVMRRIQDDQPSILKPVRLILDKENRVTILFPRMESDLFKALESGRVRSMEMSFRLNIVQNMIEAYMYCWGKKIHHLDFRITNILLDQSNMAKLNVSKPRNDSIPYPDEKAPFHVPARDPDPYKADPSSVGILEKHCLYGLTVLLWILLSNEYCRPDYADTADVEGVFAAVSQRKDVKYVSEWKVPDSDRIDPRSEALEIVRWSLETWHDNLPSWLHEFKMKITSLISTVFGTEV